MFVNQSQIDKTDSFQAGEGKPEEIELVQNEFSSANPVTVSPGAPAPKPGNTTP